MTPHLSTKKKVGKPTISASMLQAWDLYLGEVISQKELTNRVRRIPEPPTLAMEIGIAVHEFIQGQQPTAESKEFFLDLPSAKKFGLHKMAIGCDHEVSYCMEFGDFCLSGRVDGQDKNGNVHEFKTSEKAKSHLDYMLDAQWLAYVVLTGCPNVFYHVVRYRKTGRKVITIGLTEFSFSGPRNAENQILEKATALLTFADMMGIEIC